MFVAMFFSNSFTYAQLADEKNLTLSGAETIISAAKSEAKANNWNVIIAVVDDGGHLLALQRMDDAQIGSIDIAIKKAKTALAFKRPTKVFDDYVKKRPSLLAINDAMMLEGGIPIIYGGKVIAAVGVSGVTSQQDAQIAEAGIKALKLD